MSFRYWLAGVVLALRAADATAEIVDYQVTGTLVKEPLSDNLFNSDRERVKFEIRFTADTDLAVKVAAGTPTSLPSFPEVVLPQDGFIIPTAAVKSFAFRAAGTDAQFATRDVIANGATGGSVFLVGALDRPTGINLMLANAVSGYFELGILDCARQCALTGGLVIDRAGPFGTIESTAIVARAVSRP